MNVLIVNAGSSSLKYRFGCGEIDAVTFMWWYSRNRTRQKEASGRISYVHVGLHGICIGYDNKPVYYGDLRRYRSGTNGCTSNFRYRFFGSRNDYCDRPESC